MGFKDLLSLIRVSQWYKNLVIYLPAIFFGHFFSFSLVNITLGFLSLCFMSSVNYIVNDMIDMKRDKLHPEKKTRPLASGKVSLKKALALLIALLLGSLAIAMFLPFYFLISLVALFMMTQFYTLFFKHEVFLDILFIAINFVIRAVAGVFILKASISPWLILCTFFLSLFLSAGKRHADFMFLGENAVNHRKTLKHYTKDITNSLMIITTSLLILSYAIYTFLSNFKNLILTLPISIYVIFRYFYLVHEGSEISRHPEKFFKDKRLVIGILAWVVSVFLVIYFM